MNDTSLSNALIDTAQSIETFSTDFYTALEENNAHGQREAIINLGMDILDNSKSIFESIEGPLSASQSFAIKNSSKAAAVAKFLNDMHQSYQNNDSEATFIKKGISGFGGIFLGDDAADAIAFAFDKTGVAEALGLSETRAFKDDVEYLSQKDEEDVVGLITPAVIKTINSINDLSTKVNQMENWKKRDWDAWFNGHGFNRDGEYYNYDPLVLDLDGDGIEVIDKNHSKKIYFDHDNDEIKTSTSWISADDGLLTLDRNGDGVINSGKELFGNYTFLDDGNYAENGFLSLKYFDEDHNGIIDRNDNIYDQLRVWQDRNSDGVSQSDELISLSNIGVTAIDLSYKSTYNELAGDNIESQTGYYHTDTGMTRIISDINFSFDSYFRVFTDIIELSEKQKEQINCKGSGSVRDLREAATLSPSLNALINEYKNASTKEAQLFLLPTLVSEWAKTSTTYSEDIDILPADKKANNSGTAIIGQNTKPIDLTGTPAVINIQENLIDEIAVLDAFTGMGGNIYYTNKSEVENITNDIHINYEKLLKTIYTNLLPETRLHCYYSLITINTDYMLNFSDVVSLAEQNFALNPINTFVDIGEMISFEEKNANTLPLFDAFDSYYNFAIKNHYLASWTEAIGPNILESLGYITGNQPTVNSDYVYGSRQNDTLSTNAGDDILNGSNGNDSLNGGEGNDTYLFLSGHGQDTISDRDNCAINKLIFEGAHSGQLLMKKDGYSLIIQAYGTDDTVTVKDFFYSTDNRRFELVFDDRTMTMDELHAAGFPVYGTGAANSLSGWNNNDTLYGYGGNDSLYGGTGNDILDGGDGDDRLDGEKGQDTLTGGAGNDALNGGDDADTYIFRTGHGHDTVTDKSGSAINSLVFEGAHSGQLLMKKDGYSLIIQAYGTDDTVTVKDFFYSTDNRRFELVFDDRTMTMDELHAAGFPVYGTGAANSLSGWNNNDTLYGYGGNDSLYGSGGNDILDGGDGDDRLDGEKGQDTLTGGAGNDALNGGDDADTFIFRTGHGHDTVTDKSGSAINSLVFEGAQSGQLLMKKDGYSLIIQAYGTDDTVTVKDFFYSTDNRRFELVFDDRTMTMDELHAAGFPVYGTGAANSLSGWNNNDTLYGYGGNDSLYGYDGNDILEGGAGNDTLIGGGGSDTYKFYEGHGKDTLNDGTSSSIDKLIFEGAYCNYVSMEKKGYDLVINAYRNEDSITIAGYFSNNNSRRLELQFEDDTITMEELPEFVTNTLAKNDLLLAKQSEGMSQDKLLSTSNAGAAQTLTASTESAQLHQLIDAMATFGDSEGGTGMISNTHQNDYSYNHLTIPQ